MLDNLRKMTITKDEAKEMSNISITSFALMYCKYMCLLHELEVGWDLGVRIVDGKICLGMPFYGENENVTAGYCFIGNKAKSDLINFQMDNNSNGNKLRGIGMIFKCWCHSHVDMPAFASDEDENTIKQLALGKGWYYRIIMNKRYDILITLHYRVGEKVEQIQCKINSTPWNWPEEQKAYSMINNHSDFKKHINYLKKKYDYKKFLNVSEDEEKWDLFKGCFK